MIIETTIALIFIFSVLVIFHELGHFLTAKWAGIRVDEFGLGFGPRLLRVFKKGDTEYTIHAVPLGGFVKLAGMEPGEEDIPDGYQAQPKWKRALVIFAGPFASFVLALFVFVLIGLTWGFPTGAQKNRVGMVSPHTEAAEIGLRAGDTILKINGNRVTDGSEMVKYIHNRPGEEITLTIKRNGTVMEKTAVPQWSIGYLGARWSFMREKDGVVEAVAEGSVAEKAGIKEGDQLIAINNRLINTGRGMVEEIKANDNKQITLSLERNGQTVDVTVRPEIQEVSFLGADWVFPHKIAIAEKGELPKNSTAAKAGIQFGDELVSINGIKIENGERMLQTIRTDEDGKLEMTLLRGEEEVKIEVKPTEKDYANLESRLYDSRGLLGFMPEPKLERLGFAASIERGFEQFWGYVVAVLDTFTSGSKLKSGVGGPLLIGSMTGSAVALGPYWVFLMLGGLSLSLAVINLIPIPVLDGGHLAILGIEAIRRKKLSPEQQYAIQFVGFAIIVTLVVVVLFADITKLITGNVPR